MQSKATTVEQYLAELPADRRAAIEAVRAVILKNLGRGYEEGMQYGMIGYYVPHSIYPAGYHVDSRQPLGFVGLASQKNYMSLYLASLYSDEESLDWFLREWAKTGKKLDRGKSCVRFKKLEDLPLSLIGQAIKRMPVKKYIELYETVIKDMVRRASRKGQVRKAGKTASASKRKAPARKTTRKA